MFSRYRSLSRIATKCTENLVIQQRIWNCNSTFSTATTASKSNRLKPVKYSVEEVQVPTPQGNLAGKLWQAESSPDVNTSAKPSSPIICVHGWLDNAGSFDAIIPLILRPNMSALAIDLPGHGFSSHYPVAYYDAFTDSFISIHRFIRHFGWDKITLMGHGYGSELCYVMAGAYSELVDRYIALDNLGPSVLDPIKTLRRSTISLFEYENLLAKGLPEQSYSYEELLRGYYVARKEAFDLNLPACEILLKRGAVEKSDGNFAYSHDFRVAIPFGFDRFSEQPIQELASLIKCPVCVIKAESENDPTIRDLLRQAVENIQQNSEKFEFHIVTASHYAHLTDPHLIGPLISRFLDSES